MTTKEREQWIITLLNHVWVNADTSQLHHYYHEDLVAHVNGRKATFTDLKQRVAFMGNCYEDRSLVIHEVIVADEKVVVRFCQSGRHLKTKEHVDSQAMIIYHLNANKIIASWLMFDFHFNYAAPIEDIPKASESELQPRKKLTHMHPSTNETLKAQCSHFVDMMKQHNEHAALTKRESECLFFILKGYSAKETAIHLNLAYRTIENYFSRIKDKFATESKYHLRNQLLFSGLWL